LAHIGGKVLNNKVAGFEIRPDGRIEIVLSGEGYCQEESEADGDPEAN
jgi:hypothetical protein